MSNLANALFPVFLGVFVQYLFEFSASATERVKLHVSKSDAVHLVGFAVYFFTDWISCLILADGVAYAHRAFAFCSVVTVILLGFSMLSSIGSLDSAFRFLWAYYSFALIADLSWIVLTLAEVSELPLKVGEAMAIGAPLALYGALRLGLVIVAVFQIPPRGTYSLRRGAFWAGVFIRPSGLYLLHELAPGVIKW